MQIKKIVIGLVAFSLSSISNAVDTSAQAKIQTVKKLYNSLLDGSTLGEDEAIRRYGSHELRQILSKLEAISDRNKGDQCEWQAAGMIIPGQDTDLTVNKIQYSVLQNDRVRVQAKNFGQNFKVDFDVKCTDLGCNITDFYTPQSYKNTMANYARKGQC